MAGGMPGDREGPLDPSPSDPLADRSVAIAHWHVDGSGGAEYLVASLAEALDVDTVYTVGEPAVDLAALADVDFAVVDVVRDLSLPRVRRLQGRFDRVFEYAIWEDVDWREYGDPDVLVTSGATTRAVITPDDTLHVNYCHSPPRWFYDRYHDRKDSVVGRLARPLIRYLRLRDAAVDRRVDRYLANSPVIARRLRKYYNRDSDVLFPPLKLNRYRNRGDGGYYLHLGRLDREKGAPAVVAAFEDLDRPLRMAGGRGDVGDAVRRRIERAANVEYLGFVDERRKLDLLANCRALVFNGRDEDFGIVPVEANASGKAALVPDEGYPGVFVEDGENGYRHDGTADGIRAAVRRFEARGIAGDPRERVERFGFEHFRERARALLASYYDDFVGAGDAGRQAVVPQARGGDRD